MEDLEDKQLRQRITALENENSNVKEQIWKLEHGRNWMENRLTAMEGELQSLKVENQKGVADSSWLSEENIEVPTVEAKAGEESEEVGQFISTLLQKI